MQRVGSRHMGSVVAVERLKCSIACGFFLDQGSNSCAPVLADGFLTSGPPGKP